MITHFVKKNIKQLQRLYKYAKHFKIATIYIKIFIKKL